MAPMDPLVLVLFVAAAVLAEPNYRYSCMYYCQAVGGYGRVQTYCCLAVAAAPAGAGDPAWWSAQSPSGAGDPAWWSAPSPSGAGDPAWWSAPSPSGAGDPAWWSAQSPSGAGDPAWWSAPSPPGAGDPAWWSAQSPSGAGDPGGLPSGPGCPPARTHCPLDTPRIGRPPLSCEGDADCAYNERCCVDVCIKHRVCTMAVILLPGVSSRDAAVARTTDGTEADEGGRIYEHENHIDVEGMILSAKDNDDRFKDDKANIVTQYGEHTIEDRYARFNDGNDNYDLDYDSDFHIPQDYYRIINTHYNSDKNNAYVIVDYDSDEAIVEDEDDTQVSFDLYHVH